MNHHYIFITKKTLSSLLCVCMYVCKKCIKNIHIGIHIIHIHSYINTMRAGDWRLIKQHLGVASQQNEESSRVTLEKIE